MSNVIEGELKAVGLKFALVVGRFNSIISNQLLEGALDCLRRHEAKDETQDVYWVPGSREIPAVAKKLVESGIYDGVICLGAVIKGATPHFDYVAQEVSRGISDLAYNSNIPVIFGVLTTNSVEQALERAGTKMGNKGWDAALAAIEMHNLFKKIK
ncbi:MAG: 6,7-dimethyl-8-ribityllumazine synthase [Candidatus Marinimicrobia bacterium]|nr:6,7-dimethyl-8-ribityllumazine synthase [Candidatus Neomarinimicrobiota bacterium]